MAELICEACEEAPAMAGDVLCYGCSRCYRILFDLLRDNPGLTATELTRMKSVFEWRTKKEQQWWQTVNVHHPRPSSKISSQS